MLIWFPQRPVKGNAKEKLRRIDYLGSIFTVATTILILLPLNWGGITYPWSSAQVIATLVIGGVVAVGFVLWEWRGPRFPLMPLHIFKIPTVLGVYIATTLNGWVYFCLLFYMPQLLQVTRGYDALKSGYVTLALFAFPPVTVFTCGVLMRRGVDYRILITSGYTLETIALGLMSTIDQHTPISRIIGYSVILGGGMGGTFQTTMVAAQASAARTDMAVVTSVRGFLRSVGGVIGLAVGAATINNTLRSKLQSLDSATLAAILDDPTSIWPHLDHPSRHDTTTLSLDPTGTSLVVVVDAYMDGFRRLMFTLIGLAVGCWLASVVLIKRHSLVRDDDQQLKEEAKARLRQPK